MAYEICEPMTDLPEKFDIETLEKENKTHFQVKQVEEDDKSIRDFLKVEPSNYVVLPLFKNRLDHLKPRLSVIKDKYMAQRWQKFLNNVPDRFVTIELYKDLHKPPTTAPRRKSLNGQFYGTDYKLAPIPVADDPNLKSEFH